MAERLIVTTSACDFTVITPTWNRLDVLEEFFPALIERTPWDQGELIVVDQGSEHEVLDFVMTQVHGLPQFRLLRNRENLGVSRAQNMGLRVSCGNMLICLDSDHEVPEGWVDELSYLLRFPRAGCVSIPSEETLASGTVDDEETAAGNGVTVRLTRGNVNVGALECFLRGTFRKIGYFSEEYGIYGEEDADFGARIACLGLLNLYSKDLRCRSIGEAAECDDSWKSEGADARHRLVAQRIAEYSSGARSLYVDWQGP